MNLADEETFRQHLNDPGLIKRMVQALPTTSDILYVVKTLRTEGAWIYKSNRLIWFPSSHPVLTVQPSPLVQGLLLDFLVHAQVILPDEPIYFFVPAYSPEDEVQQIRIVFENMSGYVPTALVALSIDDAEQSCNKLNARLGLTKEEWTALAARCTRAETRDPDDSTRH